MKKSFFDEVKVLKKVLIQDFGKNIPSEPS